MSKVWETECCNGTDLGDGYEDTVVGAANQATQDQPHGLAGSVGEEDVFWIRGIAIAALDEVTHLMGE